MMYSLLFDKVFKKDIDKLDRVIKSRILSKVKKLKTNPNLGKRLLGTELWSLRIGKYRVVYKIIENKLLILVLLVSHRKKSYRKL